MTMCLKVLVPPNQYNESLYTLKTIFDDFLGIHIKISKHIDECFVIQYESKFLRLPSTFSQLQWGSVESLPTLPLSRLTISDLPFQVNCLEDDLPVLYGSKEVTMTENGITCGVDIIGSCFFLLSRYEEWLCTKTDNHDRFISRSSVAYNEDFIERPLVNEYIELLYGMIQHLWPAIKRKERKFSTLVTCDVDSPIDDALQSFPRFIRRLGAELFVRRNIPGFVKNVLRYISIKIHGHSADPYWTFDWMMSICEKHNIKNNFYFIVGGTSKRDASYKMTDPLISTLLNTIKVRGHGIGLHSSYNSYKNIDLNMEEVECASSILDEYGLSETELSGRQHFLRWRTPDTAINLSKAGLKHDSSLGYAETVGFRSGVTYPYKLYNLDSREALELIEHPLMVMDCTLFENKYMGLSDNDGLASINKIIDICQFYKGEFVFLWHNSYLTENWKKSVYEKTIERLGYLTREN